MINKPGGLEKTVLDNINYNYIVSRKSAEVMDGNDRRPIITTPEVRASAARILRVQGIEVPDHILTRFVNRERLDLRNVDDVTAWNIYWAQEMAAAEMIIAARGGSYEHYLPGRFVHYDLLANVISNLFNNDGKGIVGKKVLEAGSGSGLGLIMLARRGAEAYGIDTSKIGILFSQYLTSHFAEFYRNNSLRNKVNTKRGNFFKIDSFLPGSFDVVYNSGVAEHFDEQGLDNLITEMVRIASPGGYVVIAVPNENGAFYKRYAQTKDETKRQFPELVQMPADSRRYTHNIKGSMRNHGLIGIKEDGLQVAPSVNIRQGDILPGHLVVFERYLPLSEHPQTVELKIAAWRGLEPMTDAHFKMRYGWTLYYVGQKPAEIKPA